MHFERTENLDLMSLLQKLLGGFSESPGSARVIAAA
jgi:hypothetical protein